MTGFVLDTSGAVMVEFAPGCDELKTWDRLDPFTQGYVEAMFASLYEFKDHSDGQSSLVALGFAFSDLAPETLAAILKDCAEAQQSPPPWLWPVTGENLWRLRNSALNSARFPPLTLFLSPGGKVVFT